MAWDNETHSKITLARLKFASPDRVYAELRERADYAVSHGLPEYYDEELDKALFARNAPLINIGLAQFGTCDSVVNILYNQGLAGSSDPIYDKGLRLACLSNQIAPGLNANNLAGSGVISNTELTRLALEGDEDEIAVMMKNPSACDILRAFFCQKPPFDQTPSERLQRFVLYSINNPSINLRFEGKVEPETIDIHKGIYNLLQTAPLDILWVCLIILLYVIFFNH